MKRFLIHTIAVAALAAITSLSWSIDAFAYTSAYYISAFGDNFENISKKTGVSTDSLAYYNPFIDSNMIPEGTVLRLHRTTTETPPVEYMSLTDSITYGVGLSADENGRGPVHTIAVLMPFGASTTLTRQNHLATEFYKGLLLSAKNHSQTYNTPRIQIVAIDTDCRNESAVQDLKGLSSGRNTIIIPADNTELIDAATTLASDYGMVLLNVMSVRNNDYEETPNVVQCNISQALMYERASNYIFDDLDGYIPVILKSKEINSDKSGFVDYILSKSQAANISPIEITYGKTLAEGDLKPLDPKGKFVFIPASSSAEMFASFVDVIGKRIEDSGYSHKLFGYPEWVSFKDENESLLHSLGAMIYSRYFVDENDMSTRQILDDYSRWYGAPMDRSFPMQAMLGYDIGEMLIHMLSKKNIDRPVDRFDHGLYNGRQSTFRFVHDNNSKGLINNSIYIVEYLPGDAYIIREY